MEMQRKQRGKWTKVQRKRRASGGRQPAAKIERNVLPVDRFGAHQLRISLPIRGSRLLLRRCFRFSFGERKLPLNASANIVAAYCDNNKRDKRSDKRR